MNLLLNYQSILIRAVTYVGYIKVLLKVTLSWFIMGSPLFRGLNVGYWGLNWYDHTTESRYIEVKPFEQYGLSRQFSIIVNYFLTYIHIVAVVILFTILMIRIYKKFKKGNKYVSNGYSLTTLLSFLIILIDYLAYYLSN